jgi:hypothetical protein
VSDMTRWDFSTHSLLRAMEMKLEADDILDCLRFPDRRRFQVYEGRHRWMHYRGELVAVVATDAPVVVTFLWRESFVRGEAA